MKFRDLLLERDGRIEIVRLNRPKVLNALARRTLLEFSRVLDDFTTSPDSGALIVTGEGNRAFCSGGDIGELEKMNGRDAGAFAQLAHDVLEKMQRIPKPIIAAVNGIAFGAGLDLVTACDISIASQNAKFGMPSLSLGIITPFGGTQRLPLIVGAARAKHLFFTAEVIDAEAALQMGLINKVVNGGNILAEAKDLANTILEKAPIAVKYSKQLINLAAYGRTKEGNKLEVKLYAECFRTEDREEGMRAFREKRKPVFRGR